MILWHWFTHCTWTVLLPLSSFIVNMLLLHALNVRNSGTRTRVTRTTWKKEKKIGVATSKCTMHFAGWNTAELYVNTLLFNILSKQFRVEASFMRYRRKLDKPLTINVEVYLSQGSRRLRCFFFFFRIFGSYIYTFGIRLILSTRNSRRNYIHMTLKCESRSYNKV